MWWNGDSLASFLQNLNLKVSEATPNDCIGSLGGNLLPEDLNKVMLYQRNRAKLALSLLIIVEKCHTHGLQHNDLSPSNIVLHFPPMGKTKIFLGVCDWGMACRVSKMVASNYNFQVSHEMEKERQLRQHIAPELFYVFGPRGSKTCLERQKQKHLYSKASDAYVVGILAKMIWQEEPDKEMLPTSEQVATFIYKLAQLTDQSPSTRATLSDAIAMLISDRIRIRLPTKCFHIGI